MHVFKPALQDIQLTLFKHRLTLCTPFYKIVFDVHGWRRRFLWPYFRFPGASGVRFPAFRGFRLPGLSVFHISYVRLDPKLRSTSDSSNATSLGSCAASPGGTNLIGILSRKVYEFSELEGTNGSRRAVHDRLYIQSRNLSERAKIGPFKVPL